MRLADTYSEKWAERALTKPQAFSAAIVFGFTFFEKVVRFNLYGNSDAVIFFRIIKIIASFIIGIIAFPIVNLYYMIHIIVEIVRKSKRQKPRRKQRGIKFETP